MGTAVWFINVSHGPLLATTAALKQSVYTFFMGGLILQFCAYLARRPWPGGLAFVAAVVLPSVITIGATFGLHNLRGTPLPLPSTLPVAILSPPSFIAWAWRARREARAQTPSP